MDELSFAFWGFDSTMSNLEISLELNLLKPKVYSARLRLSEVALLLTTSFYGKKPFEREMVPPSMSHSFSNELPTDIILLGKEPIVSKWITVITRAHLKFKVVAYYDCYSDLKLYFEYESPRGKKVFRFADSINMDTSSRGQEKVFVEYGPTEMEGFETEEEVLEALKDILYGIIVGEHIIENVGKHNRRL